MADDAEAAHSTSAGGNGAARIGRISEKPELDGRKWPGHSVLVVPVPPLEALVRSRTVHYDAAFLSCDPMFAHAHVTLLGPFVEVLTTEVRRRVDRVLRRHRRFSACFEEVAQFPDGMIHVVPHDAAPFRRLTADLAAAFPEHPPYGGRYPDPRPHVTVDRLSAAVDVPTVESWVAPLVPARVEVSQVRLSW